MSRRLTALLLGAIYVIGVVYGTFVLILRPPPPPLVRTAPARPALSRHVLFVIIDGLRYDVATDPARMPRFAEAMKTRRSAPILAGRICMTSAAVQNYGTGQRGRFAQIVRNINPEPPKYDSWLKSAAQRGKVLALAGDPVWVEMYGKSFRYQLLDPVGVAMDADFNDQTFRDTRTLLAKQPDFLVSHFVTPDHQGHTYGIPSERYRRHMFDFDGRLFELLREVPSDWTVIVTSDHGANDSGAHGADVLIQRLSPIFAYGPGIRGASAEPSPRLDQSDLAGTFAALLGVPAPGHSQGHLLSDWLDVSEEERAGYACRDAARALVLAEVEGVSNGAELEEQLRLSCANSDFERRRTGAEKVVRQVDVALTGQQDFASPASWAFLLATLLAAALVGWLLVGQSLAAAGVCVALGMVAIALVASLEHLPGKWPKGIDAALFVVFNLPSLLFLLKPERLITLLNARPLLAAAVVPGGFAVAYPTNLQPVAFAICLAAPLTIALGCTASSWGGWWKWPRSELGTRAFDLLLLLGYAAALAPAGITGSNAFTYLGQHPDLTLGLALALLTSVTWLVVRRRPAAARLFAGVLLVVLASLLLRRIAGPWLGRPLLVGLPIVGAVLVLRRRLELGLICVLAGYLWVSRDFEVIAVAGGLGVASLLGERLAQVPNAAWSAGRSLIALGVLFCLLFLVRLGVSAGLDPLALDFGAGAFGDKNVPAAWITFAVIWKHVLVTLLLMLAFLRGVPRAVAERLTLGIVAIGVCRAAVLLGMMQCSQGSFWTSMRVMSDLPFALLFAVSAALLLPLAARRDQQGGGEARRSQPEVFLGGEAP